jgi:type VI secretion system secreted protein VgrG
MAIKIEQAGRPLQAKTPLDDPDELIPMRMGGAEGLSRLFHYAVDFLSPTPRLDPAKLLGKGIGLMVHGAPNTTRLVHGRVAHWEELGVAGGSGLTHYRAELVPWLWLLTLSSDCRTFENKTVREILEAVFTAHNLRDFKFSVKAELPKLPYVVQYQESDFEFVSRLLEEHGLHYTFEFLLDKHVLVITDRFGSLIPAGVLADVEVSAFTRKEAEAAGRAGEEAAEAIAEHAAEGLLKEPMPGVLGLGVGGMVAGALGRVVEHLIAGFIEDLEKPPANSVTVLRRERRVHTKTMAARDFHLLRAADANAETSSDPAVTGERFEFLGDLAGTVQAGVAKSTTRRRIEVEEASRDVFRGSSTACTFTAGTRVKINGGVLTRSGSELHITNVVHVVSAGNLLTGEKDDIGYTNKFVAIPVGTPYRPERKTVRRAVRGTQTAEVVGEGGAGQIDVDANGCVLLKFPWDRGDGKDGKSQHRVHLASIWAGAGWGEIHLPRIAQLVLVEFLDGDPDRPIVTGRVYSRNHAHPYALPANKTQSGIKSRSVGGGDANFNELRFEDKKGEEHVFLQAEKDLKVKVKNNETRTVGSNRHTTIGGSDKKVVQKGDHTVTIDEGNHEFTVAKGDYTQEVTEGKKKVTVKGDIETSIKEGDWYITVDSGHHQAHVKQGNWSANAHQGNVLLTAPAGKVEIKAGNELVLECGASSITLKKDGTITIKGMKIGIEATAKVEIKGAQLAAEGSAQTEIKGAMLKLEGQAMTTLKGAIAQITGDGMLKAGGGISMFG